jgi:hypothetical protein
MERVRQLAALKVRFRPATAGLRRIFLTGSVESVRQGGYEIPGLAAGIFYSALRERAQTFAEIGE